MTSGRNVEDDRRDLAAMTVPLGRALMAGEQPILARHDLTMWAYIVLAALSASPSRTQAALADAIGADRTRIIAVLDDLQARGLIDRTPDPTDRRVRLLSLTPDGHRLFQSTKTAIREYERRLLDHLPANDRRIFLRSLSRLSELGWAELTAPGSPADSESHTR